MLILSVWPWMASPKSDQDHIDFLKWISYFLFQNVITGTAFQHAIRNIFYFFSYDAWNQEPELALCKVSDRWLKSLESYWEYKLVGPFKNAFISKQNEWIDQLNCPSLPTTFFHLSSNFRIPSRKNDSSLEATQFWNQFSISAKEVNRWLVASFPVIRRSNVRRIRQYPI